MQTTTGSTEQHSFTATPRISDGLTDMSVPPDNLRVDLEDMCTWLVRQVIWVQNDYFAVSQLYYLSRTIHPILLQYNTSVMQSLRHKTGSQTWKLTYKFFALMWKYGNTKKCRNLEISTPYEYLFSPVRGSHPMCFWVWVRVHHVCKLLLLRLNIGKGKDMKVYSDNDTSLEAVVAMCYPSQHRCRGHPYPLEKQGNQARQKLAPFIWNFFGFHWWNDCVPTLVCQVAHQNIRRDQANQASQMGWKQSIWCWNIQLTPKVP